MRLGITLLHKHPTCGATKKLLVRDLTFTEQKESLLRLLAGDLICELRIEGESEVALHAFDQLLDSELISEVPDPEDLAEANMKLYHIGDTCYQQNSPNAAYIFVDPIPQPGKWDNFQVYYSNMNLSVNSAEIIAMERSFPLSQIVDVERVFVSKSFDQRSASIGMGVGALMLLGGIFAFALGIPSIGVDVGSDVLVYFGGGAALGGGFLLWHAWKDFRSASDKHIIRVKMVGDEAEFLSTSDEAYARTIATAIEEAISDYTRQLLAEHEFTGIVA